MSISFPHYIKPSAAMGEQTPEPLPYTSVPIKFTPKEVDLILDAFKEPYIKSDGNQITIYF